MSNDDDDSETSISISSSSSSSCSSSSSSGSSSGSNGSSSSTGSNGSIGIPGLNGDNQGGESSESSNAPSHSSHNTNNEEEADKSATSSLISSTSDSETVQTSESIPVQPPQRTVAAAPKNESKNDDDDNDDDDDSKESLEDEATSDSDTVETSIPIQAPSIKTSALQNSNSTMPKETLNTVAPKSASSDHDDDDTKESVDDEATKDDSTSDSDTVETSVPIQSPQPINSLVPNKSSNSNHDDDSKDNVEDKAPKDDSTSDSDTVETSIPIHLSPQKPSVSNNNNSIVSIESMHADDPSVASASFASLDAGEVSLASDEGSDEEDRDDDESESSDSESDNQDDSATSVSDTIITELPTMNQSHPTKNDESAMASKNEEADISKDGTSESDTVLTATDLKALEAPEQFQESNPSAEPPLASNNNETSVSDTVRSELNLKSATEDLTTKPNMSEYDASSSPASSVRARDNKLENVSISASIDNEVGKKQKDELIRSTSKKGSKMDGTLSGLLDMKDKIILSQDNRSLEDMSVLTEDTTIKKLGQVQHADERLQEHPLGSIDESAFSVIPEESENESSIGTPPPPNNGKPTLFDSRKSIQSEESTTQTESEMLNLQFNGSTANVFPVTSTKSTALDGVPLDFDADHKKDEFENDVPPFESDNIISNPQDNAKNYDDKRNDPIGRKTSFFGMFKRGLGMQRSKRENSTTPVASNHSSEQAFKSSNDLYTTKYPTKGLEPMQVDDNAAISDSNVVHINQGSHVKDELVENTSSMPEEFVPPKPVPKPRRIKNMLRSKSFQSSDGESSKASKPRFGFMRRNQAKESGNSSSRDDVPLFAYMDSADLSEANNDALTQYHETTTLFTDDKLFQVTSDDEISSASEFRSSELPSHKTNQQQGDSIPIESNYGKDSILLENNPQMEQLFPATSFVPVNDDEVAYIEKLRLETGSVSEYESDDDIESAKMEAQYDSSVVASRSEDDQSVDEDDGDDSQYDDEHDREDSQDDDEDQEEDDDESSSSLPVDDGGIIARNLDANVNEQDDSEEDEDEDEGEDEESENENENEVDESESEEEPDAKDDGESAQSDEPSNSASNNDSVNHASTSSGVQVESLENADDESNSAQSDSENSNESSKENKDDDDSKSIINAEDSESESSDHNSVEDEEVDEKVVEFVDLSDVISVSSALSSRVYGAQKTRTPEGCGDHDAIFEPIETGVEDTTNMEIFTGFNFYTNNDDASIKSDIGEDHDEDEDDDSDDSLEEEDSEQLDSGDEENSQETDDENSQESDEDEASISQQEEDSEQLESDIEESEGSEAVIEESVDYINSGAHGNTDENFGFKGSNIVDSHDELPSSEESKDSQGEVGTDSQPLPKERRKSFLAAFGFGSRVDTAPADMLSTPQASQDNTDNDRVPHEASTAYGVEEVCVVNAIVQDESSTKTESNVVGVLESIEAGTHAGALIHDRDKHWDEVSATEKISPFTAERVIEDSNDYEVADDDVDTRPMNDDESVPPEELTDKSHKRTGLNMYRLPIFSKKAIHSKLDDERGEEKTLHPVFLAQSSPADLVDRSKVHYTAPSNVPQNSAALRQESAGASTKKVPLGSMFDLANWLTSKNPVKASSNVESPSGRSVINNVDFDGDTLMVTEQPKLLAKQNIHEQNDDIESGYAINKNRGSKPSKSFPTSGDMKKKKSRKQQPSSIWCIVAVVALAILGLIIGVSIGALVGRSKEVESTPTPKLAGLVPTSSPLMLRPSKSPIMHQTSYNVLCEVAVDCSPLLNETSPQGLAFQWINDPSINEIDVNQHPNRVITRFALATLYYSTNGASWVYATDWLSKSHECDWYTTSTNVPVCDDAGNFVTLSLDNNNLVGKLPTEIALLSSLTSISIKNPADSVQTLYGRLDEIFRGASGTSLPQLTSLSIVGNTFEGGIPSELHELSMLRSLDLSFNDLRGDIPYTLDSMSNLEYVNLQNNRLTGGIPSEFCSGATNLIDLNLYGNIFTSVPESIDALSSLSRLNMAKNQFVVFPTAVTRMVNLQSFDISDNNFGGSLPTSIGNMKSLQELYLRNNDISGTIPAAIGNLVQLSKGLDLSQNRFSGPIPTSLGQLVQLERVFLNSNQLSGSLPEELIRWSALGTVRLDENALIGTIPILLCQEWSGIQSYADCSGFNISSTGATVPSSCFTFCCQSNECKCNYEVSDPLRCLK